jgi:Tfp pilus assembly protein PilP
VPPAPPPKTPEQLAEEAARAELAQFRLVGVVLRGGRAQGFLMKGEQSFMVNAGDRAGDRFTVETVTAEGVLLKDPRTGVSGQIGVSGK